jgi:hypothetical protein
VQTITTKIFLDVHLSDKEREAVKTLLSQEGVKVLKDAQLVVQVQVKVKEPCKES